jgi:hypothetical protein
MKNLTKLTTVLFTAGCMAGTAYAEFGISAGATYNYKAGFKNTAQQQGFANNAGAPVAGTDHFYDNGYNRVDSSGNAGNQTWYWGYQDAAQDNGDSLTMSSSQSIIDKQSSCGKQTKPQSAIEIYWKHDLTENERWNFGIRAALRWQHIELTSESVYRTTTETVSDTYSYTGILPGAPYSGSYAGPGFLLDDSPVRTIITGSGASFRASREIDAELFAFDLGPTLSLSLSEKLRVVAFIGGTVGWIDSKFSYHDGSYSQGCSTTEEWLAGACASADLQYQIGKHWGIFGGAAYTCFQDFNQEVDGRSAELQFDDTYTIRSGLFFQ